MENYKTNLDIKIVGLDDVEKPIGIFLHGFAATTKNICFVCESLLDFVPYWLVPQAPIPVSHLTGEEGYAWFPKVDEDILAVLSGDFWKNRTHFDMPDLTAAAESVHSVLKLYNLLDRKIVLAGFSQGGMVASELALLLSMQYKKLYSRSIIDTLLLFSTSAMALDRWTKTAEQCTYLPKVAIFHGDEDTVLLPNLGKALHKFWNTYSTAQFYAHDAAHTINAKAINDAKEFML